MLLFYNCLAAFLLGGAFSVIAQLLIDLTRLTPARILVLYVCVGVLLGALGLFEPLVEFAGAGASVPLVGFGGASDIRKKTLQPSFCKVFFAFLRLFSVFAIGFCAIERGKRGKSRLENKVGDTLVLPLLHELREAIQAQKIDVLMQGYANGATPKP